MTVRTATTWRSVAEHSALAVLLCVALPVEIASHDVYECAVEAWISGAPGSVHTNIVTAILTREGNPVPLSKQAPAAAALVRSITAGCSHPCKQPHRSLERAPADVVPAALLRRRNSG